MVSFHPVSAAALMAAAVIALALGAAAPAAARYDPAAEVLADFRADGKIDACRHSQRDLEITKKLTPPDIEQYSPDFIEALDEAIEARARGDCDGGREQTGPSGPVTPAPSGPTGPRPEARGDGPSRTVVDEPPRPERAANPSDDGSVGRAASAEPGNAAPAPVVWILALTGLVAIPLMTIVVMRMTGWGEERLVGLRHAWSEAAWRASGVWQDFLDFVRLGR